MADQAHDTLPDTFFLSEEEEAALAAAETTADAPPSVPGSAMSDTLPSPCGAWDTSAAMPTDTMTPAVGPDSGSGSSTGWAPPGDLYQPHHSGSGSQWSGYASSAPAIPMPSVLVRPGASDGQLLDGLSLLAPDIRQRLLTILHAMEHRQVGQAHVVLASPPGPPPDVPPQSRPGRHPPTDPTPKRRAFPDAQDFCTIACRIPGCDRLCGRPLTPRGHRNHVCRRCHRRR